MNLKPIEWEKVGDCIRCTSHRDTNVFGYTMITRARKKFTMSRFILLHRLKVKDSPLFALHTCDNSWCINPDHIVGGTHNENMLQMVKRGRSREAIGEKNSNAKLTETQVLSILSYRGWYRAKVVAEIHGVTTNVVWQIWSGKTWGHLAMKL